MRWTIIILTPILVPFVAASEQRTLTITININGTFEVPTEIEKTCYSLEDLDLPYAISRIDGAAVVLASDSFTTLCNSTINIPFGKTLLLAITRDTPIIESRIEEYSEGRLFEKYIPALAYNDTVECSISLFLKYEDIDIEGDLKLMRGIHEITVENEGTFVTLF